MVNSRKEDLHPAPISTFRDLCLRFPQGQQIQRSPEAIFSIPTPHDTLLILNRHISPSYPGEEKIDTYIALPGERSDNPFPYWKTKIEILKDLPHTQFGFEIPWLKNEGYQQIFNTLSSADFSQISQKLLINLFAALQFSKMLIDHQSLQSLDLVLDQGTLFLYQPTKPKGRKSYSGLRIIFHPGGNAVAHKGLFNPDSSTRTFANEYFIRNFNPRQLIESGIFSDNLAAFLSSLKN